MRIGQLARRLGIPPSDILGFLGTRNIETESGANSRISDEAVVLVINQFAPEKLSEMLETAPVEEPVAEVVEETPAPVVEEPVAEMEAEGETTPEAPVEVIRVSKVELQGLKVLGKIDLPEPKKKAEPLQTEQQSKKEFQKRNDRRDQRDWKNPLETKRQQEAREKEKKKQEQADRLKEQRTNNYYKKVKSVPTKAVRRVEETVVEDIEIKEAPKGILGKFLRWLRT
jgi:hypothetical protein